MKSLSPKGKVTFCRKEKAIWSNTSMDQILHNWSPFPNWTLLHNRIWLYTQLREFPLIISNGCVMPTKDAYSSGRLVTSLVTSISFETSSGDSLLALLGFWKKHRLDPTLCYGSIVGATVALHQFFCILHSSLAETVLQETTRIKARVDSWEKPIVGVLVRWEKKEEIWLGPMTKAPTPAEMSNGQSDNTNNATKSSITQRLRTDLGRSVGVTTATQLVWLTWFTGPTFQLPATTV